MDLVSLDLMLLFGDSKILVTTGLCLRQIVIMVVLVGSCLHMLPSLSLFFLQYLQVSSSPKRVKDGRSFHGYALGPASSPKL